MPEDRTDEETRSNRHTIQWVEVDKLLLDAENPRLASNDLDEPSQKDLVKILWQQMAVDEVALSIAANGYYANEELLVTRDDAKPEYYIVVEGNRRLAAVQLLRDDELREQLRATDLPEIDDLARAELDELPVVEYANREELWTFVGFQHINGVKAWDSFSKAQYVAEVHENFNISLSDIARSIGDRHATVQRLYRGFTVLSQAQQQLQFLPEDTTRTRFYFSHLYTALDQKGFQNFLGIDPERSLQENPVSEENLSKLEELLLWLYGSRADNKAPAIQRQNPDIKYLRDVVGSPDGLGALREGQNLYRAWEIATGEERRFVTALTQARNILEDSMRLVSYADDWSAEARRDARADLETTRKVLEGLMLVLDRET